MIDAIKNRNLSNSTDSDLLTENNKTKILNSSSSFFVLCNNIKKKIPFWLSLLFGFIITIILDFLNNVIYIKLYCYILCSLIILYQLLTIYLISKFSQQETKISEFYPEFIINWLKEFEELSQRNEIAKYFKDMCYREIFLYVSIIIIITVLI